MTYEARRGDFAVAAGLFGITLFLGGGSVLFPMQRMAVELIAVIALGWFLVRGWRADRGLSVNVGLGIAGLTILTILAQLIPMPPALWQSLPGRTLPLSVETIVGEAHRWRPISLDPAATWPALYYVMVPVTLFAATLHLDRAHQRRLLVIFAAFAIINGGIVALQVQGIDALTMYWVGPGRPGYGLFANKNHCALMLVAAMPAAVMACKRLTSTRSDATRYALCAGVLVFLAVTVVGCLSRAGLAMIPIGLGAALLILKPERLSRRTFTITAVMLAAGLALAFFALSQTHIGGEAIARFNSDNEGRYNFWPDVIAAIRTFFPVGSGLGTFVPAFNLHEQLANVHLTYVNHAHSDYLEVLLEVGVPGIALVIAFMFWMAITGWHRLRDRRHVENSDVFICSATIITLPLLHSIIDYPLRTLALAGSVAVAAAIFASPLSNVAKRAHPVDEAHHDDQ